MVSPLAQLPSQTHRARLPICHSATVPQCHSATVPHRHTATPPHRHRTIGAVSWNIDPLRSLGDRHLIADVVGGDLLLARRRHAAQDRRGPVEFVDERLAGDGIDG